MNSTMKICWAGCWLIFVLCSQRGAAELVQYWERERPTSPPTDSSLRFRSFTPSVPQTKCLPVKVRNPDGNYIVPGVKGDIVYRRANGVELSLDAYVQKRGGRRP